MTSPLHEAMTTSERAHLELAEVLAELVERSRHLRAVIDNMPAMIGYWDTELRNVLANQAYVEWFGKTPEQIRGLHIREVIGEELYALNRPYMEAALAGVSQAFDRTIVDAAGRTRYSQAAYVPDVDEEGTVRGFFVLVSDVTQRVEAEMKLAEATAELERRAATDPLTSLGNRALLEQRTELALAGLARAAPGSRSVAALLLDLDGFKPVNDELGHAAGDELLVEVGRRLRGEVREPDLVARLGGDEFVVLLTGIDAATKGETVAQRLVELLQQPFALLSEGGRQVIVGASIGVAVATAGGPPPTVQEVLREADRAMYAAKREGGSRYRVARLGRRLPGPRTEPQVERATGIEPA